MRTRLPLIAALVVAVLAGAGAALYQFALPGLFSARPTPPAIEVAAATWLLRHSVPARDAARADPLPADEAVIAAGATLFQDKCATCHGFDGRGHTVIGANVYPRVPSLHGLMPTLTDGQAFAYIRDGIRNTAMPAWDLADTQIWQLVTFLRHLPLTAGRMPDRPESVAGAHFVGSAACRGCHQAIYSRWSTTRMANVVRDPRVHPDAIIPDLDKPDPVLTFTRGDIAFVYGSVWKQRYFTRRGTDFFPLPAQWDITNKRWLPYHVPDNADWWAAFYPKDNMQRPTGPLCDGCHSVNYDIRTKTPTEWNVGCEACHGAGSAHVARPTKANIINPARLDYVAASDTCIRCHSQGRPPGNPIGGTYYDWPVGFHQGLRLADFWQLEEHKLGTLTFTHFPDGTAHKNRMQGNDFVQSLMYTRGVTCFSCHDPHGSDNPAMLRARGNTLCLTCHAANTTTGPLAPSIEAHTHHRIDSAGSQCVACHMPKVEETLGKVMVHAHTFRFITPAETESLGIPNPCTLCHTDKTTGWAKAALATWSNRSPWRMAE
ncbi:cytochrome c3 family protein [Acidisphaera rubrifaciens]|uniref:Cytochrome multihaem n=1 Tax=Acidisphaera rubrifaciens HS-AP3 TaxID=1231350 RepID=A0A0D6PC52_9PROT|nr:cytochrome c3 family protein [Acidisphaera rubrifaciens]GAN78439.1 cytochrome multihaem [Acidisphaera rubrifaciens HS-AP3]